MPIYVVKPYQVKEEEFEAFSHRFFTEEERNAGKHLGLLRNHTYLIRKKFNEGVQVKQQPPYLYKWIARFDDDIDLTQLSSLLEKIDNSNENVALLQADLEVEKGEPFRKKGIKQTWLAEKMGKSFNTINSYAQNRKQPRLEVLNKIAIILEVDIKDLITSSKENK